MLHASTDLNIYRCILGCHQITYIVTKERHVIIAEEVRTNGKKGTHSSVTKGHRLP